MHGQVALTPGMQEGRVRHSRSSRASLVLDPMGRAASSRLPRPYSAHSGDTGSTAERRRVRAGTGGQCFRHARLTKRSEQYTLVLVTLCEQYVHDTDSAKEGLAFLACSRRASATVQTHQVVEVRVDLNNRPWVDFDAFRKQSDLAFIPAGAVEVYGPHLPMGTDTIVVTHVAHQVADQLNAVVLPALPVGFSRSLQGFPGTLNIAPSTVAAFLRESAESVIPWGVKRIVFFNNHRGNLGPVDEVSMDLQARHGVRCAQVFWWDFVAPLIKDIIPGRGHGGEIATALMLHLEPDLVVRDRIKNPPKAQPVPYPDITRYNGGVDRLPHGVGGEPEAVNAEQGAEAMKRGVDRIVNFIKDEFGGPGKATE